VSKQTSTPPIGASGALKIVKDGIKLRKLQPPKVEGVKNSKEENTQWYKVWFPNTQKLHHMLAL
jgi:hypothetical protein